MDFPNHIFNSPAKTRTVSLPSSPFLSFRPPLLAPSKRLEDARIIQRTLVYIINLPSSVANEAQLSSQSLFGKYGKIIKTHLSSGHHIGADPTFAAYLTYSTEEEAAVCIRACHDFILEGKRLTLTFGTTKYCSYFLKNARCPKPECVFLHSAALPADTVFRDEMNFTKHIQPQDSIFDKLRVIITPPVGREKLPDVRVVRDRAVSEITNNEVVKVRSRIYSRDFCQSRYEFALDGEEEKIEVPDIVSYLRSVASPHKDINVVDKEGIQEIMDPESPLKWFVDVMHVQQDIETQTMLVGKKQ